MGMKLSKWEEGGLPHTRRNSTFPLAPSVLAVCHALTLALQSLDTKLQASQRGSFVRLNTGSTFLSVLSGGRFTAEVIVPLFPGL